MEKKKSTPLSLVLQIPNDLKEY